MSKPKISNNFIQAILGYKKEIQEWRWNDNDEKASKGSSIQVGMVSIPLEVKYRIQ